MRSPQGEYEQPPLAPVARFLAEPSRAHRPNGPNFSKIINPLLIAPGIPSAPTVHGFGFRALTNCLGTLPAHPRVLNADSTFFLRQFHVSKLLLGTVDFMGPDERELVIKRLADAGYIKPSVNCGVIPVARQAHLVIRHLQRSNGQCGISLRTLTLRQTDITNPFQ
jgi:hypothetical protein